MDEHCPGYALQISQEDWERTPASVKQLVKEMQERLGQLEKNLNELQAQQQLLKEKTNRTSSNSSQAPSSDPPSDPKRQGKRKSGKKRGGQPGHEGHSRPLYSVEQCESVTDYYPESCACCGERLSGEDANPYRHQIVDIPPITLKVEEHRLHKLVCKQCGSATRAELPAGICPNSYGPAVVAMVAVLSGVYRHLRRMVQSAVQDLFGISMSLGTVNSFRQEASAAVAYPVEAAHKYVQLQPVVGADETSWEQGNADARNPNRLKAWLWVAVTPLVTYFQVILSRSSEAAQNLLGPT